MPYKILSLDGGGIWGLVEVKTLIRIYGGATRGNEVLRQFDLVAANSAGSIVLGGLVENMTLEGLLDLFMDVVNRSAIFSLDHSIVNGALQALLHIGPKYSAAAKLAALKNLMPQTGNRQLQGINDGLPGPGGAPVRLIIAGFDYDRNRGTFFRSTPIASPCLGVLNAADYTMAEVIHASSNAPVDYFDGPATYAPRTPRYWDGGVSGHNNPVLAAVTEAMVIGVQPRNIAALSLGTGMVKLLPGAQGQADSPYYTPWKSSDLAPDIGKIAGSILDDPPDTASFIAHIMTLAGGAPPVGEISRIVRMNPVIAPAGEGAAMQPPGGMSVANFTTLCGIGIDALPQPEVDAIAAYTELWLAGKAPNQPIHTDDGIPPVAIGHADFATALAAWNAIE